MGKRLREIERKYESDGRSVEPELTGLPGVAAARPLDPAELDAVYYDTPDLRLAARRITLRRRTGGDDAGWHLKLPTDQADTRTEVHVPLGRSDRTVPEELAAEVAAHSRGRPLVPVVRIKNHRRRTHLLDASEAPLVEIAHDEVTAQRFDDAAVTVSSWAETEVELVGGGPKLLDAVEQRLKAAGSRRSKSPSKLARALGDRAAAVVKPAQPPSSPDTAGEVALVYLHKQVRAITGYDSAVRRDEPDAVHRMRVATRRLRSALKSFRRQLDRTVTDPIGDELKWLAGVLGMERDREVLVERLAQRIAELDDGLATVALQTRLLASGAAEHERTRETLLRELNGERYFTLLDTLDALLASPPYTEAAKAPAGPAVTKTVRRDHRRLRRLVESGLATGPGTERDVALHEARKAAKRARYSSEAAKAVLGKPAKKHAARMKAVQSLLGEHQDSVICRETVARAAQEAHRAGEDTFPYSILDEFERIRSGGAEERLPALWRDADRGKLSG
jgi:CHAD domain-containing protein